MSTELPPVPPMPADVAPPPAPRRPRRLALWIGLAVAAVGIVVAAIVIPLVLAAQAKAQAEAEAAAAAAEAEEKRLHAFAVALDACAMPANLSKAQILDGGESMEIDGISKSFMSPMQVDDLYCILEELGAPETLEARIGQTRALDGRQTYDWDGYAISWSYHPDDGANVIIEHTD